MWRPASADLSGQNTKSDNARRCASVFEYLDMTMSPSASAAGVITTPGPYPITSCPSFLLWTLVLLCGTGETCFETRTPRSVVLDGLPVRFHEHLVVACRRVFCFVFSAGLLPHLRHACGVRPSPRGLPRQILCIAGGEEESRAAISNQLLHGSRPRCNDHGTAGEPFEHRHAEP